MCQLRSDLIKFLSFVGCKPGKGMECSDGSSTAIKKLGETLRHTLEELFGPTLHLSSASMELMFPTSFHRLSSIFYRSKVTSWMAAQEEDYRWASFLMPQHALFGSHPKRIKDFEPPVFAARVD